MQKRADNALTSPARARGRRLSLIHGGYYLKNHPSLSLVVVARCDLFTSPVSSCWPENFMTRRALAWLWLLCADVGIKEASQRPSLCRRQTPLKDRPFHIFAMLQIWHRWRWNDVVFLPPNRPSTGFALSTLCVFYAWQFLQLSFTCLMGIFMRAPCFSLEYCPFYDVHFLMTAGWSKREREWHTHGALNWPLFRFCPATRTYFPLKRCKE